MNIFYSWMKTCLQMSKRQTAPKFQTAVILRLWNQFLLCQGHLTQQLHNLDQVTLILICKCKHPSVRKDTDSDYKAISLCNSKGLSWLRRAGKRTDNILHKVWWFSAVSWKEAEYEMFKLSLRCSKLLLVQFNHCWLYYCLLTNIQNSPPA